MEVEAFAERRVVAVSAGTRHSLALTADGGAVWSWGWGAGASWATATGKPNRSPRSSRP